jgi:hypothetical protein
MKENIMKPVFKIIFIWLAWALIMVGYQAFAQARFQPQRPDNALFWTATETLADSNAGKPYLLDPFLNNHVAWDSEFYLSIATVGYDDPVVRGIPSNFSWETSEYCTPGRDTDCYSLSYAFFPFYPYLSRLVTLPLRLFPLTPIAASTLAALLVSMLGTLGAMLALYDLTRDELEESGALRAVFYLLIFPSGFFLAQVYTEGLFVGLAFGTLAFLKRRQWLLAGLLAAFATWTRAVGGLLFAPLILAWLADISGISGGIAKTWQERKEVFSSKMTWKNLASLVLVFSPVIAYLIWNALLGRAFHTVEDHYFSRGFLLIEKSSRAWFDAYSAFVSDNLQTRAYYGIEFAAILFSVVACALTLKRYPLISIFGLLVIVFSFFSGSAQGMHRYVLAVPSMFIVLGRWGRNEVFDRSWTLASVLIMGLMAALFSFDFWAG